MTSLVNKLVDSKQIPKAASKSCQGALFQIIGRLELHSNGNDSFREDLRLQKLLEKFSELFQEVISLPPVRSCDQQIPLLPNTGPIDVRSYRYP